MQLPWRKVPVAVSLSAFVFLLLGAATAGPSETYYFFVFSNGGSRKLCNIISGDACGPRDFSIQRFRVGFDCRLSGKICSVNVFRTSDDQLGRIGLRSMGILIPDRGII